MYRYKNWHYWYYRLISPSWDLYLKVETSWLSTSLRRSKHSLSPAASSAVPPRPQQPSMVTAVVPLATPLVTTTTSWCSSCLAWLVFGPPSMLANNLANSATVELENRSLTNRLVENSWFTMFNSLEASKECL